MNARGTRMPVVPVEARPRRKPQSSSPQKRKQLLYAPAGEAEPHLVALELTDQANFPRFCPLSRYSLGDWPRSFRKTRLKLVRD